MTLKDNARAALRAAEQEQDSELQADLLERVNELQQEAIEQELAEKRKLLAQIGIIPYVERSYWEIPHD